MRSITLTLQGNKEQREKVKETDTERETEGNRDRKAERGQINTER